MWPSICCSAREHDRQPQRVERLVAEQRDHHGREGADRRPDVGDQLGEAVERAERERIGLALGEDPERAEDVEADARAGAHDQREQELAADVAEHRALHAGREVVLGRAVARRHDGAHTGADAFSVEQHVDAEDDDQDQRDRRLCQPQQRVARERDQLAGALRDAVAERVDRGPARLGHLQVDPVAVEPVLDVGERVVDAVDDRRHLVAERRDLVGDRVGEQHAEADDRQQQDQVDGRDRRTAREVRAPQQRHERVEQQCDQPGDDEHEQHRPGSPRERPGAQQQERQHHELDPARDDHRLDVGRRRGGRRLQRERCLLDRLGRRLIRLRSLFLGVRFGGAHLFSVCAPGRPD